MYEQRYEAKPHKLGWELVDTQHVGVSIIVIGEIDVLMRVAKALEIYNLNEIMDKIV